MKEAMKDPGMTDPGDGQFFGINIPFMAHLGLKPVSLTDGRCVTEFPRRPELLNSRGDLQGGALMSAFDLTLSAAARSHDPLNVGAITVDMSIQFYEAARSDLVVEARCTRRGRSMAFCDGEVRDVKGVVVAVARGVFKLVSRSTT